MNYLQKVIGCCFFHFTVIFQGETVHSKERGKMAELVFLLICLFCDVEMDLYSVIGLDWVFFN